MSLHYLSDMNTRQVQKLQKNCNLAFLPIGPTEVHSYYLPTRTDVELAMTVSERAAAKLAKRGIETLIGPAINNCVADGLNVFPGNMTLRPSTVSAVIEDLCLCLAKWGFTNVLVISGHGEPRNCDAINEGIRAAMQKNSGLNAKQSEWIAKGQPQAERFMKSEHPELEIHAGEHEVGLMMLRHPELVDVEALQTMEPNWASPSFWDNVNDHNFIELGAPDAYFGNPRLATPEVGDKVFDVVSDYVVEEVIAMLG